MIYYSGYTGLSIWFLPTEMFQFVGGASITGQLVMANMVNEDVKEYTKTYFLLIVLGLIGSLVFVSVFWHLNPIPGYAYTYTVTGWPVEAMNFWRWQTWLWTGNLFGPKVPLNLNIANFQIKLQVPYFMVTGFFISAVVFLVSSFIFHRPFYAVAMLATAIPTVTPFYFIFAMLIGSIVSNIIGRVVGRELWNANKGFLVYGFLIGDGLVSTILIMATLISKSTWLLPY
jgi:hypothetical protein